MIPLHLFCQKARLLYAAGRASWENAKDAAADTGRYLTGRAGAVANGDNSSYSKLPAHTARLTLPCIA